MTDLELARKQEIRYQLLLILDSARPSWLDDAIVQRGLKVESSLEDVRRELGYLQSRKLVDLRNMGDRQQAMLLAAGVDLLEGNHPELAGLIIVDDRLSQSEKNRRKVLRWILLRMSDRSRPILLQESLAQRMLHDVSFVVGQDELRRLLTYLEQKGLLQIDRRSKDVWQFTPTADGVDVCEYSQDCPPGIDRQ